MITNGSDNGTAEWIKKFQIEKYWHLSFLISQMGNLHFANIEHVITTLRKNFIPVEIPFKKAYERGGGGEEAWNEIWKVQNPSLRQQFIFCVETFRTRGEMKKSGLFAERI